MISITNVSEERYLKIITDNGTLEFMVYENEIIVRFITEIGRVTAKSLLETLSKDIALLDYHIALALSSGDKIAITANKQTIIVNTVQAITIKKFLLQNYYNYIKTQ